MKDFSSIYCMADGEIVERGSYDSLIESRGLLFHMIHSMNREREGEYRPRKDTA